MSRKLFRVGRSKTGLGLFAITEIPKGRIVTEYRGRRISNELAESREKHGARYMFELNSKWTVDGSPRWNLARYANHSCRPNAEADIVRGKILLRAIRRIRPDDEITYDYGKEYFDLFFRPSSCLCAHCDEKKRSKKKASSRLRGKKPKKRDRQLTAKQ
jgi:SET domain-containing protein